MRWILTDPREVEPALKESYPSADVLRGRVPSECLPRFREPSPSCLEAVLEQPPLSLTARLEIYAHHYFVNANAEAASAGFGQWFGSWVGDIFVPTH